MENHTYRKDLYYFNYEKKVGYHIEVEISKFWFWVYKNIYKMKTKENVIYRQSRKVKKFYKEYYD